MEAAHHGADRDVEHLGDLLVGEPLDVGEVDGQAELLAMIDRWLASLEAAKANGANGADGAKGRREDHEGAIS